MDATQQIEDPFSEEEEEKDEKVEDKEGSERERVATLKVFKNEHIPEAEFPLYIGENVLGRDPASCSVLLPARSVSGRHAAISVFRSNDNRPGHIQAVEALIWDMGSLNGTRKGRLKLTPQVRYALGEGDSVVLADLPCQYIGLNVSKRDARNAPEEKEASEHEMKGSPEPKMRKGMLSEKLRGALPPVPLWSAEDEEPKTEVSLCSPLPAYKQPEITLVPDSDSGSDEESATDERRDVVSESTSSSHLVSPSDSTFLTPAKKVIPESEDESLITPSSATMNRFTVKDSFSEVFSDSSKTGPLALNLESDSDVEEGEKNRNKTAAYAQTEVVSKVQPVSLGDLHMDSDTDVEEEETGTTKDEQAQRAANVRETVSSAGLHMDSDTDVEEEPENSKSEIEAQIKEASKVESATTADLHIDSDTDVEEEEIEKNKNETRIKEAPTVEPVTSSELHVDSITDVEENDTNDAKTSKVVVVPESPPSAPSHSEIHLDSDTDVEDENPINIPMVSHPVVKESDLRFTSNPGVEFCMDSDTDVETEEDEDPFKSPPCKTVKDADNQTAYTGSRVKEPENSTHKQIHSFQEEPTQAFDNLEDWDLQATQSYGGAGGSACLRTKEGDLESTQAYGEETEEEEVKSLSRREVLSNLSTAETQLIPTANNEDEEMPDDSHLSTADTLIIASTPRREEHTQHFALFTHPTQLIWEEEEKEVDQSVPVQLVEADTIDKTQDGEEENPKCGGNKKYVGMNMQKYKNYNISQLVIAETQPVCEDEDVPDEGLNSVATSRHTDEDEPRNLGKERSSSHIAIAETQPVCEDEDAPDEGLNSVATSRHRDEDDPINLRKERPSSHIAIAETQPVCEHEDAPDECLNNVATSRHTDEDEPRNLRKERSSSHIPIAETQPMCDEEGASDEDLNRAASSRNTDKESKPFQEEPSISHVTTPETEPMFEEDQTLNTNLKDRVKSRRCEAEEHKVTQLADKSSSSHLIIAETYFLCEYERVSDEDLKSAANTNDENKNIREEPCQATIAETQLIFEEEQAQNKDIKKLDSKEQESTQLSDQISSAPKPEETVQHSFAETQPLSEEHEPDQNRSKMSRRSRRGRPKIKEDPQPEVEEIGNNKDISGTVKSTWSRRGQSSKVDEEDEVPPLAESLVKSFPLVTKTQPEEKTEEEGLNSGKPKRSRRGKPRNEAAPVYSIEPNSDLNTIEEEPANAGSSRQTGGWRHRKEKTDQENKSGLSAEGPGRARKGQEGKRKRGRALSEDEEESEEERTTRRGTRRTGMKQKYNEKEEEDELEDKNVQDEKETIEREQQEDMLEIEEKDGESWRQLEEKVKLKREEEEKLRKEKEENEIVEQLRRESEEKDRFERELKEKLERQQKKEEEERDQREKMGKELKDKEHLQRLEAERVQLEKPRQENEMLEMAAEAQLNREQKEMNQKEEQKTEMLEEKNIELNASVASSNDDVPARRTRRHSNSSMNSEQTESAPQEKASQRGRGRSRGRGRGRRTSTEDPVSVRRTERRKTIPGPTDYVEETEQASITRSRSRSSSRSSDRSSISMEIKNQATRGRGRGRKSVKIPQPEKENPQAKTPVRGRGRGSRLTNVDNTYVEHRQDADFKETALLQTNSRGRKRTATASTSSVETPPPTPKTPRRSTASQMHKVLFTGLTDEEGERVVARLGGTLAKGVNDMTHLVTDKARRTVKFLCAVARGVPIVTPDWLKKCGRAGHFLSADEYLLKDFEQEKKFSFSLQAALQAALHQPLLKGYDIHVTQSVIPEPSQMKEIITCCGARFLPKMPSSHKEHTVVVSCEQDRAHCEKALSMSLPVVSTEFLLTGILQQKVDLQAFSLTFSPNATKPTAPPKASARGRRK